MSYEAHKYQNGIQYASIVKDVKNQQLFMDLHAGIAMGVKANNYDEIYMWVL